jgi:4-phospho-D-threonate 3-dehydrogenase / 4-phospho-D-erythronate 3-dehydrogenase
MRISGSIKPRICITIGYPAGIGPEIISKALASPVIRGLASFLIVGNEDIFKKACQSNNKNIIYTKIQDEGQIDFSRAGVLFFDIPGGRNLKFREGKISGVLGRESIYYIEKAVKIIGSGNADILVTAPISKVAAGMSGFGYKGHTEFLAQLTGTQKYAMMLVSDKLKVFLATTHVPVRDISGSLNRQGILDKLVIADLYLKRYFKVRRPIIAVCGLNPHAGDNGLIGSEERDIILPAIKDARRKGVNAKGPLAADAVFFDLIKGVYDAVLCMYHDQGLPALKMIGRNSSVNITLGLPFIRTSPGHGTALDIAGAGLADPSSMRQAIKTAVDMYRNP